MIINITNPKYKIINSLIGWKITCLPEIIEKKKTIGNPGVGETKGAK